MSAQPTVYPPDRHFLRDLGVVTELLEPGRGLATAPLDPAVRNAAGCASLGFLTAAVDIGAALVALAAGHADWTATADLSLHATGWIAEGPVTVESRLVRAGSKLVTVVADILDGRGERQAVAQLTFARIPRRAAAAMADFDPADLVGQRRIMEPTGPPPPGSLAQRIELTTVDPGAGVVELVHHDYVTNSFGTINGGVFGIVFQHAAESAVPGFVATDVQIHYLDQTRVGPARTTTTVLRRGADHAVCSIVAVDAGNDDHVLALATVTLQRPPAPAAVVSGPGELRLPPDLARWRDEVRSFLRAEMAPARVAGHVDPTDLTGLDESFERAHHRAAAARGLLGISVPAAEGGGGRPWSWKHVYDLEAAYHSAPSIDTAVTLCGTPLALFGSEQQKERWLRPMIAGEMLACIAYSERTAGNDLAAIATTATRDAGGWVLDGHKALVTGAHKADVALVLALADPGGPPRRSMAMFLVPMDTDGVEVVRRSTLNGWTLGEISLRGVRVGPDALLGEEGKGWSQVLVALEHERGSTAHLGWAARRFEQLPAGIDPRVRARLEIELVRARNFYQRLVDLAGAGDPVGHEASVAKVVGTELLQRISREAMRSASLAETEWQPLFGDGPGYVYDVLEWIHPTISIGANETHRDMIAAAALGAGAADRPPAAVTAPGAGPATAGDRADESVLALCAEAAEGANAAFEIARERVQARHVFGRPVADFQVSRHRIADMFMTVEAMQLAVADARQRPPGADRRRAVSVAKVICNEGFIDVTASAHQLCGGEGYYADQPLGAHTRRAWAMQAMLGTSAQHLERLGPPDG